MSGAIQQGTGPSEGQTIKFGAAISPSLDAHCDPPIHRLPPEILVEVVRNYVQRDTSIRDLIRLTLVCKRWSNIVQDAPSLWTTINAAEGPSAVRKAMQVTKDALLDLRFDYSTTQMDKGAFFKAIGEQSGRCRTLVVCLDRALWDSFFVELQKGTPSSLEVLHLSSLSMADLSIDAVSVVRGNWPLPRLKEIFLVNIPINLASLQLSGLRSLIVTSAPGTSGTDLINIIRGSPAIECICLDVLEPLNGIPPLHEAFSHPVGNPSIQLASLVQLSLCDIVMPFLKFLLSAIATPRLETLNINCELSNVSDAQLLLDGLHQQLSTLARLTTDAQNFKFVPSSWGAYQIAIGGLYLRFLTEDLPLKALEETWDWVFNHLGKPLKDLPAHLHIDDWEPEISARLEWLNHRLTVTKLSIQTDPYSGGAALDPLIPLFSRPTTSTPATWLFPQAEILETNLVQINGNDDLVEMVKNRHSAADGKNGLAAPKPFREIWLAFGGKLGVDSPDPMNMEFLRKVEEVASGADVYWEKKKLE
ncbi:hypothetical protein FRC00_004051 [Tulasnella sp. 408]|nr:hypothetical protein FRC00_004051 [Tulasnella sp. 408]